jgi:serine/threonine protein kinase
MAAVYAATHRNRRRAALKILHPELARDGHVHERFLREGYLGNRVEHPGRVETLDNDVTEDGAPFLVMELLEGENLAELWRRMGKKLPAAAALRLVEQLLDFLSACHAQGIVHRDLKPANVFVTRDQRVKVLDFGVAQLRDEGTADLTRAGTALGTPAFMAPEQARGLGDKLDGRADIFSVGAMLYALLSGQRLHQGRTSDEALVLAATQPAQSLARIEPDLPVEVIALVDKALAWDRRNRFQSAAEMRAEVLRILERPSMRAPAPIAPSYEVEEIELEEDLDAELPEGHPHVERLRAIFKQIDRLLPAVRQYGFAHPETERRLRGTFEEIVATLTDTPVGLSWDVRPYSFEHRGRSIWEPAPPFDSVPWSLFDAGLRFLQIRPGFAQNELRALVEVMLTDPSTDLAPEDDLVTVLWDRALPNVSIESADGLAEGGAAARERFFAESSELEGLAGRAAQAEARAMNVSTVREAETRSDALSSILALDAVTRAALETQLRLSEDRFRERWYDVLVEALLDATAQRDESLVLAPLAKSAADMVAAKKPEAALATLRALTEATALRVRGEATIAAAITRAMLGGKNLPLMAGAIAGEHVTTWAAGLAHLGAGDLPHLLRALERANDARVRDVLVEAVGRVAAGREAEIAQAIPQQKPEIAHALVAMLAKLRTPSAQSALRIIASGSDLALRIAALSGTDEATLKRELGSLIDHENASVRVAALQAVARHQVKDLAAVLARKIEESFHDLPVEERVALLDALQATKPERAEQLAIAMISQRSMLKREAREQSRLLCIEHLGMHARSKAALEAVSSATKGLLGGSKSLEAAAGSAIAAITARNPS